MGAFEALGVDRTYYNERERKRDEAFPWEHTSPGVARAFLRAEWERAVKGELTPDCRRGHCTGCAVCPTLDVRVVDGGART